MRKFLPIALLSACAAFAQDTQTANGGLIVVASQVHAKIEGTQTRVLGQLRVLQDNSGEFSAEKPDASINLYLSNGLGIYTRGEFQFSLVRFSQQPFIPGENDRNFEPSRSQVELTLKKGDYGFWRTSARATSDFFINTPLMRLRCEANSFSIWVQDDKISFFLADGTANLEIPQTGFKEIVQSGQYIVLNKADIEKPYPLKIERATSREQTRSDKLTTMARWSYRRIRFEQDAAGALMPRVYIPKTHFEQRPVGDPNL